jgi:hypothetical protein
MPGPFTLLFPAKPDDLTPNDTEYGDDIPRECLTSNGGPGNTNSVIAYATSSNIQGPYNYKGIVMCGSTTEWTNQATITQVDAAGSHAPYVIAYHDSPQTIKERKIHAECLFAGGGMIAGVRRQAQNDPYGFDDCVGTGAGWDYSGLHVSDANYHPGDPGAPRMLQAQNGGADPVKVNRYAVGTWERFKLIEVDDANNYYAIQALANNKYLCASLSTSALKASCTSTTSFGARFRMEPLSNEKFRLFSVDLNEYLSMNSTNFQIYADASNTGNEHAAVFVEMKLR